MKDKRIKEVTEADLEGIIIKNKKGYSLHNLGERSPIKRINALKMIEKMDIDIHNREYLAKMKERIETFDKNDGFNEFGFNEEGMHRNGTEYNEKGFNSKGWIRTKTSNAKNYFTGDNFDINGFDKQGFDRTGFNERGYDRAGKDREGFYETGFNDEGIHKETKTKYGPDGMDSKGFDSAGFDREGLNKNGKTIEDVIKQQNQQRKNFLGLRTIAEGYSKGQITTEEYLKSSKSTLDELIDFAKKQKMGSDVIIGLQKRKGEYNKYKTRFSKAKYFQDKTTINGIEVTEEIVDKVLKYLKENDRLLCTKIVNEHIRAYVNGDLDLESEKYDETNDKKEKQVQSLGEETLDEQKETSYKKRVSSEMEMQKEINRAIKDKNVQDLS